MEKRPTMWLLLYMSIPLMSTNHLFLHVFLLPCFMRYPAKMTLLGSAKPVWPWFGDEVAPAFAKDGVDGATWTGGGGWGCAWTALSKYESCCGEVRCVLPTAPGLLHSGPAYASKPSSSSELETMPGEGLGWLARERSYELVES